MLPPKVRLPLPFFSSEPAPETGVLKLLASLRLKRKMAPEARLTEAAASVPLVPALPICNTLEASTVVVPEMLTSPVKTTAVVAALLMTRWPLPLMAPFRPREPLVLLASMLSVTPFCTVNALFSVRATTVLLATVRRVALPVTLTVPVPSALLVFALAASSTMPFSTTVPPLWLLPPLRVSVPVPRCTSWPLPLISPSATVSALVVLKTSEAPVPTLMDVLASMVAVLPVPMDRLPLLMAVLPL